MEQERSFEATKATWEALTPEEQGEYRDDYQAMILDGGKDAGDHPFHAIFAQEERQASIEREIRRHKEQGQEIGLER